MTSKKRAATKRRSPRWPEPTIPADRAIQPDPPRPEINDFGGRPTIETPAQLLCEIFNAATDDVVKGTVLRFIKRYKWIISDRGHVAEGFVLVDGRLTFDSDLFDEACYRGKMSTYLESAADAVKKLRTAAFFVGDFNERHSKAARAAGPKAATRVATDVPAYPELAPDFLERTFGPLSVGRSIEQLSGPWATKALPPPKRRRQIKNKR